jgi:hypothetical protein
MPDAAGSQMKLTFADLMMAVADAWGDSHIPSLELRASRMVLMHPFGHSVKFDLTRRDLTQPIEVISKDKLVPAIEKLRKLVG